ncbi:MAG TPA: PTS system mannose/fructose/sorbose family transporter subunit IID [Erysipelotrichaceae bacterium]|jgi:mannose/fructose/N-acetylgalactosamine-specific phosphotransferase system component IID|nr:PTS system mannose/fructose/sorbose family transporter subunit IID [Erysipelotrichaceae bacterium]HQA85752.1 PTS system mannose/fructose/sorbose family transporter subunit IID [Erysipelotrichaceae bacterium]
MSEVLEPNVQKERISLTQKDLTKCMLRFAIFPMSTINYERFQTLQFFMAMSPILEKLYSTKEDRIAAGKRHMAFFNTTPEWIGFIIGLVTATEEQAANMPDSDEKTELQDSTNVIKASLMGPLAGIGDSLRATADAIIGAISAGFALSGSILGALTMFVLGNIYYLGIAYYGYFYSYKNGMKVISEMNKTNILERIMHSATILGMTALGALIPSWVGFNLRTNIHIGDYVLDIQAELDKIIPGLAPLAFTLFVAWLYRKNMTSLKLVGLIFVLALVFSLIGISL